MLTRSYEIAFARPRDLVTIAAIELAAARLLVGHAPESVLSETTPPDDLAEAQRRGHLWVALVDDAPVGFAHVRQVEADRIHLDELDVHPDFGRRGIGSALVRAVCAWAAREGFTGVTLTTFRDVPWNRPFYERLGFNVIRPADVTVALRAVVDDETRRGLDPTRRVVMQRPMGPEIASPPARLDEQITLGSPQRRASLNEPGSS